MESRPITSADLEDPRYRLLKGARDRARRKGLPFNLTLDDIEIPERCPLLGIPLQRSRSIVADNSPTLDRKEPAKGYVRGNVWVISDKANRIKSNATPEELIRLGDNLKALLVLNKF